MPAKPGGTLPGNDFEGLRNAGLGIIGGQGQSIVESLAHSGYRPYPEVIRMQYQIVQGIAIEGCGEGL